MSYKDIIIDEEDDLQDLLQNFPEILEDIHTEKVSN